jgi:hypothetical protein
VSPVTLLREAFATEIAGFDAKNVYTAVLQTADMRPLSFQAIFKVKFHADGTLDKFKVRLVVGGHRAIKDVDFHETFSPVLSIIVLRLVLAIFAAYPHVITTVADVEQAYLNSHLNEVVHVRAPAGMILPQGYVLRLLKAIYGMPQAGREFWKLLRSIILALGFKQSAHTNCFFWKRDERGFIILMTYVDDITTTTDCPALKQEVFDAINKQMKLQDRGVLKSFLGMEFTYSETERYWSITQETYTLDVCAAMNLYPATSKAAFTPEVKRDWTAENSTAKSDDERRRVLQYNPRSHAGKIMWLIVCNRPDLMHCVKNPCQFMTDPGDAVVDALTRIGRYLLGTAAEGIRLYGSTGKVNMHVASDADDAGGSHRRSMICYVTWIGSPLTDCSPTARRAFVQWTNTWSVAIASGSMESEIYGIHAAIKGSTATRGLLGEVGLHDGSATHLSVDSASSMTVLQGEHSEKMSTGVKHIDRRVLGVRQHIAADIYAIDWVPSPLNPADLGATYKSRTEFDRSRTMLVGYEYPRSKCAYLRDTEEPSHWSKKTKATDLMPANKAGKVE